VGKHLKSSAETEYEECRSIVKSGLQEFWRVGDALARLRDKELYRCGGYETFEECCREEFGISRQHGYRLIDSANVYKSLSPIGDILPTDECQIRSLARLEPPDRMKIWKQLTNRLPLHEITGRVVQNAVRLFRQGRQRQKSAAVSSSIDDLLTDDLPPEGYRVIYADPPWQYGNTMPDYYDEQVDHYRLLTLPEICDFRVGGMPVRKSPPNRITVIERAVPSSGRERSYASDYMRLGRLAEDIVMRFLKRHPDVIGINDLRELSLMQEADVDVSIRLAGGRVTLAEIKYDSYPGDSGNVLFELLRINHTCVPDRMATLGWAVRSPATRLLCYAPANKSIYRGRLDELRRRAQRFTAKVRNEDGNGGTSWGWACRLARSRTRAVEKAERSRLAAAVR